MANPKGINQYTGKATQRLYVQNVRGFSMALSRSQVAAGIKAQRTVLKQSTPADAKSKAVKQAKKLLSNYRAGAKAAR